MLVVPAYRDRDRAEVRRLLEEHIRRVGASLAFHRRVKVWHATDQELPRTSTRKVKRAWVVEELKRLEAAASKGARVREAAREGASDAWILDLLSDVCQRPRGEITHSSSLSGDLGFDSLMHTELAAALEQAGVPAVAIDELHQLETVADLARAIGSAGRRRQGARAQPAPEQAAGGPSEIPVPEPLAAIGRKLLGTGQRLLYRDLYETVVHGAAYIPRDRNFLVVANHASHLDMGLVKVALGDQGSKLAALAAADYFFDTALKRAYFENFTNLVPMERAGSVRGSLRAAAETLRRGMNLLIFPEGTRSRDGIMAEFKPTAGYLALHCAVDTLPVYIRGTYDALPPGHLLPRPARLEVFIGQPIRVEELRRRTETLPRGEAHKEAARIMEREVRRLSGDIATATPTPSTQAPATGIAPPSATPAPTPAPVPLHPRKRGEPPRSPGPTAPAKEGMQARSPEDEP
jgi:long-chain acyl-CoA synthetase